MNSKDNKNKKSWLSLTSKLFGTKSTPSISTPDIEINSSAVPIQNEASTQDLPLTESTPFNCNTPQPIGQTTNMSLENSDINKPEEVVMSVINQEISSHINNEKSTALAGKEDKQTSFSKFKFPGFKILDKYITRKFLGTYIFAIMLIIVVVVVFDAVEKMDDFITTKATIKNVVIDYYLNFIPYFVNQFSGLFTFIAVIFFTSKMAYQTEIIAILSSGVSFKRLMWPYFVSAMIITALSLSLNLWIIPSANERRVEFERKHFTKNITLRYEKHIYRQIYPGTFAYIRNYNGKSELASFLAIEQYDGSRMTGSLDAADVSFDPDTRRWMASKYITRTFDENNVETMSKHNNLDTMINLDVIELGKLEDIIQTMNIGQLDNFIKEQKEKGSDMVSMFEVERQNRYAYPMATFILTVIGLSLSSRKVRGGTGLHIGIGISLCFTYIMACRFAAEFAKNGSFFSPTLLVWLPNILFAIIAIYLYRKAPK